MAYTNDEIARQVIAGKWGNGSTRKSKLAAAGYDYNAVQNSVNKILGGSSTQSTTVKTPTATAPKATTVKASTTPSYYSQSTVNYGNQLKNVENNKPGAFTFSKDAQSNAMLDDILNRKGFSYDFNADPLYQQYKDQYTQQGELAMRDTMGEAAALSGGYGNSYATSAGSQAYQGYLSQLNNVIPELYDAAYNRYKDEGDQMTSNYGLLQDLRNTEYGQYRDKVSDYDTDRSYLAGQYQNGQSYDYGVYNDTQNRDLQKQQLAETVRANKASESEQQASLAYQKQQDAASAAASADKSKQELRTSMNTMVENLKGKNYTDDQIANELWGAYGSSSYFDDFADNYKLPGGTSLSDAVTYLLQSGVNDVHDFNYWNSK